MFDVSKLTAEAVHMLKLFDRAGEAVELYVSDVGEYGLAARIAGYMTWTSLYAAPGLVISSLVVSADSYEDALNKFASILSGCKIIIDGTTIELPNFVTTSDQKYDIAAAVIKSLADARGKKSD